MTPLGRGLLGAVIGTMITLVAHPATSPYFTAPFRTVSLAQIKVRPALPAPVDPASAAYWMETAAEKLQHGTSLSPDELDTLTKLSAEASVSQPDNAFWPQIRAVLLYYQAKGDLARQEWFKASRRSSWDDLQTVRLVNEHARLCRSLGSDQSWTLGYTYFERSDAAAAQIQRYCETLVQHTEVDNVSGLLIRYASIRNGSLLRSGSRSIRVGIHGAQMVEQSTYPPSMGGSRTPKRIWIARTNITARLRQANMVDEASIADEAFKNNEAWLALTERRNPDENVRNLCVASIGLASFAGCQGIGLLAGLLIFGLGCLLERRFSERKRFPAPLVIAAAFGVWLLVFLTIGSWIAAASVGCTLCFLIAGPKTVRTRRTDDLGPLYNVIVFGLWILSVAGFSVFLISTSPAARALLPRLGPAGEYLQDSRIFLGVTYISLSLLCLVAPGWSIVRRYGTPDMFAVTLKKFGAMGAVLGIVLCILSGPVVLSADRYCGKQLQQILTNEPVYYLLP